LILSQQTLLSPVQTTHHGVPATAVLLTGRDLSFWPTAAGPANALWGPPVATDGRKPAYPMPAIGAIDAPPIIPGKAAAIAAIAAGLGPAPPFSWPAAVFCG
jgi:hypothetical protein